VSSDPTPRDLLAARFGLFIPPERVDHLNYCLRAAARDAGFASEGDYVAALHSNLPTHATWQRLLHHLAIGETYFFRDVDILRNRILPELIAQRRADGSRVLRVWSAGCSTGEEPYTIAILLREMLPDIARWKITILGTDINLESLTIAQAGLYTAWSMRGATANTPYLRPRANHWQLSDLIRQMVEFRFLNLIDHQIGLNNADLIVCRNVLMYIARDRRPGIIAYLNGALAPGGELLLDAGDSTLATAQKSATVMRREVRRTARPEPITPHADDPIAHAKQAADQAKWAEAHLWLDKAEARNVLDLPTHYLRALVYDNEGRTDDAIQTLQRCLYLDHNFALGYFTLGNLFARCGRQEQARQHWVNAAELLQQQPPQQVLDLADGMTVADVLTLVRAQLGEARS